MALPLRVPPIRPPPPPPPQPPLPLPVVITLLDSLDKVSANEDQIKSYTSANGHSVLSHIKPDDDDGHIRDGDNDGDFICDDRGITVADFGRQRIMKSPYYLYLVCKKVLSSCRNTADDIDGDVDDHAGNLKLISNSNSTSDWDILVHFGDERENVAVKIRRDGCDSDETQETIAHTKLSITLGLFVVEQSNIIDCGVCMLCPKDNIYQIMKGSSSPFGGAGDVAEIRICPVKESFNASVDHEEIIATTITFWESNDGNGDGNGDGGTLKRFQIDTNRRNKRHQSSGVEAAAAAALAADEALALATTTLTAKATSTSSSRKRKVTKVASKPGNVCCSADSSNRTRLSEFFKTKEKKEDDDEVEAFDFAKIQSRTCTCSSNDNINKIKIGNIRRFCGMQNKLTKMIPLYVCLKCNSTSSSKSTTKNDNENKINDPSADTPASVVINLSRGGQIVYFLKIIGEEERDDISKFMDKCNFFRQYRLRGGFNEPRVHVLLSSQAERERRNEESSVELATEDKGEEDPTIESRKGINENQEMKRTVVQKSSDDKNKNAGPGYVYHGVKMKALPISNAPPVQRLGKKLGAKFQTPNHDWNIGVDLIVYRKGADKIGWHADDTQGEDIIVSVVVETDERRVVKVRPKKKGKESYRDGDEMIELIVRQGDGYVMNAEMQHNYEHSVPVINKCESKRKVLVFRSGMLKSTKDNGEVTTSNPVPPRQHIWFGHPPTFSGILVGKTLHTRQELADTNVHKNLIGGVCGNKAEGCSSIIVSNQNGNRYGCDKFRWLMYAAGQRQLGHSLITSYKQGNPVRVFRSSKCDQFAPPYVTVKRIRKTRYRYDGLYRLTDYCKVKESFVFFLRQICSGCDKADIKFAPCAHVTDWSDEDFKELMKRMEGYKSISNV